jgi:hypothetical protein
LNPVVLLVVAKGSELLFQCLVLPGGLTVRLRVEFGREEVINTEVGANSVPKLVGRLFATIGGDIISYASFADHMFEEHSFQLWGLNVLSAGKMDRHFSRTVDDYHDPGVFQCD